MTKVPLPPATGGDAEDTPPTAEGGINNQVTVISATPPVKRFRAAEQGTAVSSVHRISGASGKSQKIGDFR